MPRKQFVGFGFGPIQSGLMLYEAMQSGNFGRFTVAEVDQEIVSAVRANGNKAAINIAKRDAIVPASLDNLQLYNPTVPADRERLAEAIRNADEMATAIPNVKLYAAGGDASIAALLAAHVNPDKPQLLYASENNNYAAEILHEQVLARSPARDLSRLQILNTVIGKMSGVIRDPAEIGRLGLATVTPALPRAVLVEEFNRILVSQVTLPDVRRGITVFEEKANLLPFEEAKLFGHNAIHSLLGYLAASRGYTLMSRIRDDRELCSLGRRAFIDECGAALVKKHAGLGERLFTPDGWQAYAEDLLDRMTNPYLHDAVERICRDPARKLGYSDRLFGTIRECLTQQIEPRLLARGALAALRYLTATEKCLPVTSVAALDTRTVGDRLTALWQGDSDDGHMRRCVELVVEAGTEG